MLSCMVVPSVQSSIQNTIGGDLDKQMECYMFYTSFGKVVGGTKINYFPYQFSCCGCYNGRHICSHLLASLVSISIHQLFTEENSKIILNITSPINIQNIATPIELCKYANMSLHHGKYYQLNRRCNEEAFQRQKPQHFFGLLSSIRLERKIIISANIPNNLYSLLHPNLFIYSDSI